MMFSSIAYCRNVGLNTLLQGNAVLSHAHFSRKMTFSRPRTILFLQVSHVKQQAATRKNLDQQWIFRISNATVKMQHLQWTHLWFWWHFGLAFRSTGSKRINMSKIQAWVVWKVHRREKANKDYNDKIMLKIHVVGFQNERAGFF